MKLEFLTGCGLQVVCCWPFESWCCLACRPSGRAARPHSCSYRCRRSSAARIGFLDHCILSPGLVVPAVCFEFSSEPSSPRYQPDRLPPQPPPPAGTYDSSSILSNAPVPCNLSPFSSIQLLTSSSSAAPRRRLAIAVFLVSLTSIENSIPQLIKI